MYVVDNCCHRLFSKFMRNIVNCSTTPTHHRNDLNLCASVYHKCCVSTRILETCDKKYHYRIIFSIVFFIDFIINVIMHASILLQVLTCVGSSFAKGKSRKLLVICLFTCASATTTKSILVWNLRNYPWEPLKYDVTFIGVAKQSIHSSFSHNYAKLSMQAIKAYD